MCTIELIRNHLARGPAVAVIAATLLGVEIGLADQFPPDPVEELRLELKSRSPDRNVPQRVQAVRTLADMRRALALQEWSQVDSGTERRVAADPEAQLLLATRFTNEARRVLKVGADDARLAVMVMLAEMGPNIRVLGPEFQKGIARALAPDLAELIKRADTPLIRETAARTLGKIFPDPDVAFPALRDLLASPNVSERRAAANGLAGLVRTAGQFFQINLADQAAAEPQDIIQAVRDVVPVAGSGLNDPDLEVRRSSAEAMFQAAAGLNDLVPKPLPGEEPDVVEQRLEKTRADLLPAVEAFKGQAPALGKALNDPDPEVRVLIQRALEKLGATRQRLMRSPPLKPAPASTPGTSAPRGAALGRGQLRLVAIKLQAAAVPDPLLEVLQELLPPLERQLRDPDVQIRLGAVDVLEEFGNAAVPAAPALVQTLADPDRFVRWAAARTLGKMGPVQPAIAVPGLARLLFDNDLDVRLSAAVALERFGPAAEAAVPYLVQAIRASDAVERAAAIRTLAGIGTGAQPAVPALSAALSDPDARVRLIAAEVLAKFGPLAASAEPALRRALDDPDSDVRSAASDALLSVRRAEK